MDWNKTKLFYHVVKSGSITEAARKINVSQPALSRSMLNLEKELGYKLLIREKRGILPTSEGEQLYEHAKKMADSMKIAIHELIGDATKIRGPLKVVTSSLLASKWVMHYLQNFQSSNPYVRVQLHSDEDNYLCDNADIHISVFQHKAKDHCQHYLATLRSGLYSSKSYLDKYGMPSSVTDLDTHKIIAMASIGDYAGTNYNWSLKVGKEKGCYRKPYIEFNLLPCLLKAATEGMGIVELPIGYPAAEGIDLVEVLPMLEGPSTDIYFIVHKDKENIPRIKALLDSIKKGGPAPEGMPLYTKSLDKGWVEDNS